MQVAILVVVFVLVLATLIPLARQAVREFIDTFKDTPR